MKDEDIVRINELAKKAKIEPLTPEEKQEQSELRKAYIASFRQNLKDVLDRIEIQ